MLHIVKSGAVIGLDAYKVVIEVDVSRGVPAFTIVGLPDAAVQESRERVKAAVQNSEYDFKPRRITVNLAPADTRKEGPAFDLPIALATLLALGQIEFCDRYADHWLIGELSLTGEVRSVKGILPIAVKAAQAKAGGLLVPMENAAEASVVKGIEIIAVGSLTEAAEFLSGERRIEPAPSEIRAPRRRKYECDYREIKGQLHARRALEIAAAGGHNVLMEGPPGSGKTMLARRLPTIMPQMSTDEAIEVTKVYSVSGRMNSEGGLMWARPFRAPHHTISTAGLAGGGQNPRPGEISLSHRGVLFLDEMAEFGQKVLEVLRQPLESQVVTISRANGSFSYPANFLLVAAMNPCPCGYFGDRRRECECSLGKIRAYKSKVSGPLLDRFDMHVEVPRLGRDDLAGDKQVESSAAIRKRVVAARKLQLRRHKDPLTLNGRMPEKDIKRFCRLAPHVSEWLLEAVDKLSLTGRGYDRILRVGRTIADLRGREEMDLSDIAEAIQYKGTGRG